MTSQPGPSSQLGLGLGKRVLFASRSYSRAIEYDLELAE